MSKEAGDASPLETSLAAHWLAVLFALLFPTAITWVYFVWLSGEPSMQLVYSGGKVVQFAFPLAWFWYAQRRRIRLTKPDGPSILWGVAFGLLAVGAGLAAYYGYFKQSPGLAGTPEALTAKVADMGLRSPALYLAFAAFLSVPHSLLEEYYWRWFGFGQLRRAIGAWPAILFSSLAFMSHHAIVLEAFLPGSPGLVWLFSGSVAFGGAVWAWLYYRHGSLWGPWVSHLLVDCGVMYIGYDLIDWQSLTP